MSTLVWQQDLNTGIDVIDQQHMRIVDMLNQLHVAQRGGDREAIAGVIEDLIDYTLSHFAFEEELMQEAGYPLSRAHTKVHEIFTRRVNEYRIRFHAGEDVTEDLRAMLSRWLFNHIRSDDKGYASSVLRHFAKLKHMDDSKHWVARAVGRLFGRTRA